MLEWFPDNAACLAYLERLRWAGRLHLPGVRRSRGLAHREGQADVRGLWPADVRDPRDDLPSDPDAVVDVVRGSAEPTHVNLPGVHVIGSLLKRWRTGTLHYAVSQEHRAYDLDEYTFRFNRRKSKSRGLLFYRRLLQQAVETDPHPLADLRRPVLSVDVPF